MMLISNTVLLVLQPNNLRLPFLTLIPNLVTGSGFYLQKAKDRDEVKEIKKTSAKDTSRIRVWRFVSACALLLTTGGLTLGTYEFLSNEEEKDFKQGFLQAAKELGDSAILHQENLRSSLEGFSKVFPAYAMSTNLVWPEVTLPLFESYAETARKHGNVESIMMNHLVKKEERDTYLDYVASRYKKWIQDGHLYQNGNVDGLMPGEESYHPFITATSYGEYYEDVERDAYWPL